MVWRESQRCGDRVGGSVDAGSGRKNCRWKGRGFDSRGDHAMYKDWVSVIWTSFSMGQVGRGGREVWR